MIQPGDMVRFSRWRALGWTAEPRARRVLDVRPVPDSDEQEITFTGLAWGPGKHFEVVELNRVEASIAADRAARAR